MSKIAKFAVARFAFHTRLMIFELTSFEAETTE